MFRLILLIAIFCLLLFFLVPQGSRLISKFFHWMSPDGGRKSLLRRISLVLLIGILLLGLKIAKPYFVAAYSNYIQNKYQPQRKIFLEADHPIYPVITSAQQHQIDDAIKITFTGDLILLRDVVENAYNTQTGKYDFNQMFQYGKEYWKNDDLSIGVFEGPMVKPTNGYSNSRCDDGYPIHLNFPTEYGSAVKKAGIDLVTLANNHLLDQGEDRYKETLSNLDSIGLPYVGAYRNPSDRRKNRVKIVTVRGKRLAVLSYTYNSNNYPASWFFDTNHEYITGILAHPDSSYFDKAKKIVIEDFNYAKSLKPDAIIVLPHMGTQGVHTVDEYQSAWMKIFVDNGADIVFADHPHTVQPIEWRDNPKGGKTLIVYCPGNFVNSYTYEDEDESMIVETYLDKKTGKPFAASIVPLYAYSNVAGNYIGMPIYKIMTVDSIFKKMSTYDFQRIQQVHKDITKYAIGCELPIDNVQERYFYFADCGYVRNRVKPVPVSSSDMQESKLLKAINEAKSVTFVGNSLTEGTMNGGYGWYEPIAELFKGKRIDRFAKGSMTSVYFKDKRKEIAARKSNLFVISIGCNDIRYRDPKVCAMTPTQYLANISELVKAILKENKQAKIIFIAPWKSIGYDSNCKLTISERNGLYSEYILALRNYCQRNRYLFIDPNAYIEKALKGRYANDYLKDWIHPNAFNGIQLYSKAVIESSKW